MLNIFLAMGLLLPSCLSLNKVLIVSFAGFRYDYLDTAKTKGRNISAFEIIISRGFRGRVVPVMPTVSYPTHFAIITGRYTQHHGIMNNFFVAPDINSKFDYGLSENNADYRFWDFNGNEPIWITNQRHGKRTSCTYFWPGSYSTYGGQMPTKSDAKYDETIPVKDRVDQIIDWMNDDVHMSFCALYVEGLDYSAYRDGPDSDQVMNKIEDINSILQYIIDRINASRSLRDVLNLIITSGNGVAHADKNKKMPLYNIISLDKYIGNTAKTFLGMWPKPGMSYICIFH